MLFFGHTGTTLGLLWLLNKIAFKEKQPDYRLAFLGSILPDIIDKPLGLILLRYNLGDGRTFAHTLIFPVLLFIIGLYFARRKENNLILLSACVAGHLILDQMWLEPSVLLWPAYGIIFPYQRGDTFWVWFYQWLSQLKFNPQVFVPEIIGFTILLIMFAYLVKNKKTSIFIWQGKFFK